jgi:hypothetical protein
MKIKLVPVILALAVATLQAQQNAPAQAKGKMGMMGQMADHMKEMQGGHREMAALVEKLAQSFAAVQLEKDPVELAKKLGAHGELLKELQAKLQAHSQMMDKMEKEDAATPAPATEHKH